MLDFFPNIWKRTILYVFLAVGVLWQCVCFHHWFWFPPSSCCLLIRHESRSPTSPRGCSLPIQKEMATHSSVLAWRIPGTGEPAVLPSLGLHRVGHDWSDLAAAAAAASLGKYLNLIFSSLKWEPYLDQRVTVTICINRSINVISLLLLLLILRQNLCNVHIYYQSQMPVLKQQVSYLVFTYYTDNVLMTLFEI